MHALAHVALVARDRQRVCVLAADVGPVAASVFLPLVGCAGAAVRVAHGRQRCDQTTAFGGRAGHGQGAGRCIVNVGHHTGGKAGLALSRTQRIRIAGNNRDGFTDLVLRQCQRVVGGTADGDTTRFPLVADRAQTIHIFQIVCCRQNLPLQRSSCNGHAAAGRRRGGVDTVVGG